jgi:hypothetical protein
LKANIFLYVEKMFYTTKYNGGVVVVNTERLGLAPGASPTISEFTTTHNYIHGIIVCSRLAHFCKEGVNIVLFSKRKRLLLAL